MSAFLLGDLNGTTMGQPSLSSGNVVSGQWCGMSGVSVGYIVDLRDANTFCGVWVAGLAANVSGPLIIGVQNSDDTTSGSFGDPTSGLSQFPTVFSSGGNIVINSGSTGGIYNAQASGQSVASGFWATANFVRTGRYARLVFNSGFYVGTLQAGFISALKTTGSGGGFSYSPTSGTPSV